MTPPTPPGRWRRVRRPLVRWAVGLVVLYRGVVAVFLALETSLVFQPSSPAESWLDPADPDTRDVAFTSADGTPLHGWWLPPRDPAAGAVLVAHGNGGNVSHRGRMAADLRRTLGAGVLLMEYPGYGKSGGTPSEAGCYAAGDAAYRWLTEEEKVPPGRVVLFGESLGGGTAVELATRHDHRALVLAFTFTSLPAAAKHHYPWLPTHTLMRTRFDNLSKLPRCHRPVFIAHGTADEVIPFRQGEELFAAANEPKEFLPLDGFSHNLLLGEQFYAPLRRFLDARAP
ncbi:MAG: alpha/beta hydrolase [Gemmataceae bacterium]|nr:alpha/beta hydrolase [Gemmataceae bacterium]